MAVLELNNVTKKFGGLTAVGNVNLKIEENEIYGLIGPNGAGKTTIFNLITGIYELTEGNVQFNGKQVSGLKPNEIAEAGITRTFQNIRLFKNLTTYDNILTACHFNSDYTMVDAVLRNKKFKEGEAKLNDMAERLMDIMALSERKDMIAGNLPYGYQRRLEIARAVALQPKVLLLDEPAAGMNEEESIQLMDMIKDVRDQFNLTILIIEHHMDLIMNLCDKMTVLNFGQTLAIGTPSEIQSNPKVIEAYLGEGEDA